MNNGSTSFENLATLFERQVAAAPASVAIRASATEVTYAELGARASRLAALLQSRGVKPGVLVAIAGERGVDYIVAIVATVLAGGAYLPIDSALPRQRVELMVNDARPGVILASRKAVELFSAETLPLEEALWTDLVASNATPEKANIGAEDLVYVMYTSGSTGTPKGVAIPQRGAVRLVHGAEYATFGPGHAILQLSTLSFDAATYEIWGSFVNGGTLVMMPVAKPSLQQIEEALVEGSVTALFITTALFAEIADRRPAAFHSVKEVLVGGETIPAGAVRRVLDYNPRVNVIACYGPTECTTFASAHRYRSSAEVGDVVVLGEAIAATELLTLREDMTRAGIGEEGDLYVAGAGLALGYLHRPELTAQAFLPHPFALGATIYRTGDRVVTDERGRLLFRGRRDAQIKLRGFRIELGEIESALQRHAAVQSAYVKTEQTAARDKAIVAYIAPSAGAIAPEPERDARIFAERTAQWEQVYSKLLYRSLASVDQAGGDPTLNSAGWKSSFDGRPISVEEMEEQVGETVKRVLALKPKRVLELGCGTGMLLFRLAPHVESYVASDFSRDAIDYVARLLKGMPWLTNVELHHKAAHELPTPPDEGFDVVVLNSVTEHFVSVAYLDALLAALPAVVARGGYVFIGDNRNATLLAHFHGAIQLLKHTNDASIASYRLRSEIAAQDDAQLTIDPYFFAQRAGPQYSGVSIQVRRGKFHNEMTGYRYDATLQVGGTVLPGAPALARAWNVDRDSVASLKRELATTRPEQLLLTGIPNARLRGSRLLLDALDGTSALASVGELRREINATAAGVDPRELWTLGEELNYDVQVLPARDDASGALDVVLRRDGSAFLDVRKVLSPVAGKPLPAYGNDPLLAWRKEQLMHELRRALEQTLPEYAVPSFLVPVPRFPLNVNRKIDAAALPAPARLLETSASGAHFDGTPAELRARAVWEEILGVRNIALHERFFDLGGDSLKAVRVAAELSARLNIDISPALLFEEPTLRGFATLLDSRIALTPLSAHTPPPLTERSSATNRGARRRAAAQAAHGFAGATN